MAKLSGFFKVKGKFGGGTAYNTKNGNIFRSLPANSREKYDALSENSSLKRNNREFTNVVKCANLVCSSFGGVCTRNKLVSQLRKTLQYSTALLGERVPATIHFPYRKIPVFPSYFTLDKALSGSANFRFLRTGNTVSITCSVVDSCFLAPRTSQYIYFSFRYYLCWFNFELGTSGHTLVNSSSFSPIQNTSYSSNAQVDVSSVPAGSFAYILTALHLYTSSSQTGFNTSFYGVRNLGIL